VNLYLDTSSLAKLFLKEEESEATLAAVREGEVVGTSLVSYVEMRSLVSRRLRERLITREESERILDVFDSDWQRFGKIPVDQDLLTKAGKLLMKHPLRSLDAIHLSSALLFQDLLGEPIVFMTADQRLQRAAEKEKLKIP
jgi:uncharacterized protein